MKFYFTLNSIPELANRPKALQKMAWRTCYWKAFRHWQGRVAILCVLALVFIVPFGIDLFMLHLGVLHVQWLFLGLVLPIGVGIMGFVGTAILQLIVAQMRPYLKEFVKEHQQHN